MLDDDGARVSGLLEGAVGSLVGVMVGVVGTIERRADGEAVVGGKEGEEAGPADVGIHSTYPDTTRLFALAHAFIAGRSVS